MYFVYLNDTLQFSLLRGVYGGNRIQTLSNIEDEAFCENSYLSTFNSSGANALNYKK